MRTCIARKQDGTYCTYRAKYDHHCGYHHKDGYHKNKSAPRIVPHIHVEEAIDHLTRVINELRLTLIQACQTIQEVSGNVTSIKHRVDVIDATVQPIMTYLATVTQTVARIPIVGRFVT